jgi:GTP cyclohydrolase FolE2
MIERGALLGGDVQSRRPLTLLSLSRVGVTGLEKVVRVRSNGAERLFYAERHDVTKREWLEDVPGPEKA